MTSPPMIRTHGLLRTAEPTRPAVVPRAHKDNGESGVESQRIKDDGLATIYTFFQTIDADSGNQRDVTGDERQHARRQKREYARKK